MIAGYWRPADFQTVCFIRQARYCLGEKYINVHLFPVIREDYKHVCSLLYSVTKCNAVTGSALLLADFVSMSVPATVPPQCGGC